MGVAHRDRVRHSRRTPGELTIPTARTIDDVRSRWLVSGRWIGALAAAGTAASGLRASPSTPGLVRDAVTVIALIAISNLWLRRQMASGRETSARVAGAFLCVDVLLFSWLLWRAGGALNPAATFYLVEIVLAALVVGRGWTWAVSALSAATYGVIFLTPGDELLAAQLMHPGIALHMHGMWLAFVGTAAAIAFLATRFVELLDRRESAMTRLRDRASRHARAESLATAVAGAAHELSSPLATVAVAAHELETALGKRTGGHDADLAADARLIREQADRCRRILDQMAGRFAGPSGETPVRTSAAAIVTAGLARCGDAGTRVRVRAADAPVVWPAQAAGLAVANLVRNALQASAGEVNVNAAVDADGVRITVSDKGAGMSADVLNRAGEPFFTTRADGMGLGLFVTRSSVEALGGRLTIESRERTGTTATIWLPQDVTGAAS